MHPGWHRSMGHWDASLYFPQPFISALYQLAANKATGRGSQLCKSSNTKINTSVLLTWLPYTVIFYMLYFFTNSLAFPIIYYRSAPPESLLNIFAFLCVCYIRKGALQPQLGVILTSPPQCPTWITIFIQIMDGFIYPEHGALQQARLDSESGWGYIFSCHSCHMVPAWSEIK